MRLWRASMTWRLGTSSSSYFGALFSHKNALYRIKITMNENEISSWTDGMYTLEEGFVDDTPILFRDRSNVIRKTIHWSSPFQSTKLRKKLSHNSWRNIGIQHTHNETLWRWALDVRRRTRWHKISIWNIPTYLLIHQYTPSSVCADDFDSNQLRVMYMEDLHFTANNWRDRRIQRSVEMSQNHWK